MQFKPDRDQRRPKRGIEQKETELQGVQQGLFRVEITHPTVTIPAKYNIETKLGKEVSFELGENVMRFDF